MSPRPRHDPDDPELDAARRRLEPLHEENGPLFSEPPIDNTPAKDAGREALERAAAKHEAEIARLIPLAQELARKAGPAGITVADVRLAAVQRGLLTGRETGRELSYLGAVMLRSGLQATGHWRRSHIVKSHANPHRIWAAA